MCILFLLFKYNDDNECNSCTLVVDWLIVLLFLLTGADYQDPVAQVEVIAK